MTKKISTGIAVALIIFAIVVSSTLTLFVVFSSYNNLLVDLPQRAEQYLKLGEIDELIRAEYFGDINTDSVDEALASGYINGLDDPNSYYIAADDVSDFNNLLNGISDGIGVSAYYDFSINSLIVSYVYGGSPANAAGIVVSDKILSVNGNKVSADNYVDLLAEITESANKKLKLEILSASDNQAHNIELTSGFEMQSVSYLVNDSVGYIRLNAFYKSTTEEFKKAISFFKDSKISSVILDLRNSSGIDYDVAAEIIDIIVPVGSEGTGAIYTARNQSGDIVAKASSDSEAVNMSFAILINTRTEGAAELVACDLKDFGKGILIGEPTAGYGTMQKLFSTSDGGCVLLTVAEIYPYISDTFNNSGLKPDFEILTSESFKNQLGSENFTGDEQYEYAKKYLTGK